jgi:chemotaxis protein MotB
LQGGSGAGQSNSIITGGGSDITQSSGQTKRSEADPAKTKKTQGEKAKAEAAKADAKKLASLAAKIAGVISNNPKLAEFSSQIKLEVTPDGLQIQIVDNQKRPMFDGGSASVKPYMREILQEIGLALLDVENKISLDGHTDRTTYGNAGRGYSNWELSSDRANSARRELAAAGMPEDKLARVVGMASSVLLDPADPLSPTNRRISILVMTKEAEERLLGTQGIAADVEFQTEPAAAATPAKSAP